jgi:hypothetical protein
MPSLRIALLFLLAWAGPFTSPALAQSLGGFMSPGDLAEDHVDIDGMSNCTECHELGSGLSPAKCLVCHDSVAEQVKQKTGFHSDKGTACETCHSDHKGRSFAMVTLVEETFDHTETGFGLDGAHNELECQDCHTDQDKWLGLQPECVACHDNIHEPEKKLDDCTSCHDADDWNALPLDSMVFNHGDATHADYALEGRHRQVDCQDCHGDWVFAPVAFEACTDCHDDPHSDQFDPRTCDSCHTVDQAGFEILDFDHNETDYRLTGEHTDVSCAECHGEGPDAVYLPVPHSRCESCHADPHEAQFAPADCDECHSVNLADFALDDFDHDATDFPLVAEHLDVACVECHGEGPTATFASLPAEDCSTCHDDPHEDRFAPSRCDSCHLDGDWATESFDHDRTAYPLTNSHQDVACEDCHGTGDQTQWAGVAFDTCLDCHAEDDPHEGLIPGKECTDCHETVGWSTVSFDHLKSTDFPLEGRHSPLPCEDCHAGPAFADEETECEACHADDEPPRHFDGACEECHEAADWVPATLGEQGHAITGFPLNGAHMQTPCNECHERGEPYSVAQPSCVGCHAPDSPHRNLLGDNCQDCHSEVDWFRVRFHHGAQTGFVLRGPHRLAACQDCHATGYAGTPQECWRCHENDKPRDSLHSDPFVQACDMCHRPFQWEGATYPHGG